MLMLPLAVCVGHMDELLGRTLQQDEPEAIIRILGKMEHQLQSRSDSQQSLDPQVAARVLQLTLPRLLYTKDITPEVSHPFETH